MRSLTPLALLLALAGCSASTAVDPAAPTWPEGRTFTSTSVTEHGAARPLVTGTQITMRFAENYRIVIQAGCNELGVRGRLEGSTFVAESVASTAMGCPDERLSQDAWITELFDDRPELTFAGDDLTVAASDIVITLRA